MRRAWEIVQFFLVAAFVRAAFRVHAVYLRLRRLVVPRTIAPEYALSMMRTTLESEFGFKLRRPYPEIFPWCDPKGLDPKVLLRMACGPAQAAGIREAILAADGTPRADAVFKIERRPASSLPAPGGRTPPWRPVGELAAPEAFGVRFESRETGKSRLHYAFTISVPDGVVCAVFFQG